MTDPQNPYSAQQPATTMGLITFIPDILTRGKVSGSYYNNPVNLNEMRADRDKVRAEVIADPTSYGGIGFDILVDMDKDIANAENIARARVTHMRYEVAKMRQRMSAAPENTGGSVTEQYQIAKMRQRGEIHLLPEMSADESAAQQRRALFGIPEGTTGVPPTPEPGSFTELGAMVLGIPGHLYTAFVNARTPEEQADAIGSAAATAGMAALPFATEGIGTIGANYMERGALPTPFGIGKPTVSTALAHSAADYLTAGVTMSLSHPEYSRGVQAVMDGIAARRNLNNVTVPVRDLNFTREIETPEQRADRLQNDQLTMAAFGSAGQNMIAVESSPPTAHVGQEVRPGEIFRGPLDVSLDAAEQAAIKQRLMAEGERNISQALVSAHKQLTPYGTTIIPGIQESQMFTIANSITAAERTIAGRELAPGETLLNQAVHRRPNGVADIAVYGDRSPLMNKELRDQFREHGYFAGQEVSWNGKNYALSEFGDRARALNEAMRRSGLQGVEGKTEAYNELFNRLMQQAKTDRPVLLRDAEGNEHSAWLSELRRSSSVDGVAEPFAGELHTRPYTVGDIVSLIGQEQLLSPAASAAMSEGFFELSRLLKGQETRSYTTGQPLGPLTAGIYKPGLNTTPVYNRPLTLDALGDQVGPETTVFTHAGPDGQPVAHMEVNNQSAVVGWFMNPDAPKVLQARAALALMEHAHSLGIDRLLAPVDEVGARLAARYMNSYFPPITEIANIRARVREAPFDYNGLYRDFKDYQFGPSRLSNEELARQHAAAETRLDELMRQHPEDAGDIPDHPQVAQALKEFDILDEEVVRRERAAAGDPAPQFEKGAEVEYRGRRYIYKKPFTAGETGNTYAELVAKELDAIGGHQTVYAPFNEVRRIDPESFDTKVEEFARERGFLPEEVAGLKRYLGYRMAKEGREIYFTPDEQAVFDKLAAKMHPLKALTTVLPLDYLAVSNNMLAEWTANGVVEVRTRETGELLGRFRHESQAREFINGSGQADGPDLDGGGRTNAIPPSAIGGGVMPPAPPRPPTNAVADGLGATYLPPGNRIPRIMDMIRTHLEYLSPMEGWISSIDNVFGTKFSPGFRATQSTLRRAQGPMLDYLKRLHTEVDQPFFKGLTEDQRAMVFRAIETMTPAEVIARGFFRPLNQNEVNIANWMAAHHIDTARTLKYSRDLMQLESDHAGDEEALNAATAELTRHYNLDQDHVIAANTFKELRKQNPNEIFIGHITRLADAIMSDALSRADFIKEHNMPPSTLEAIRRLESILDEVADRIGVPAERRVRGWIAHFRAQMEPKGTLTQAFLGQRGLSDIPEMKFLNELARTGEISMVETDPVIAATRYIRGAFLSQEFIPTWNNTLKTWKGELAKMPIGARQKVERVLESYLSEIRGIPEASRMFTEEVWSRMTKEMGMEFTPKFNTSIVNTIIAASSAGPMAFRVAMGLRDLGSAWAMGTAWFGPKRFARMMELGWDDAAVKAGHEKGYIPPGMTPIEFSSPVDLQTSVLLGKFPGVLNRVADVGMRGSLQPLVYDRVNAGAYLEAHELASHTFSDLAAGKIDKVKAYENMDIDKYEPSFVQEFDGLVDAQKYEQAADLLGTQTQRMVTPTYGLANHPYKWGTNSGRLIGQYGTWPVWLLTNLARMMTRGSAKTRFKVLARFAATQAAIYVTGKALGFDLYSWMLLPGLRWMGGPVVGTARAVMNIFSPSQTEQAQGRAELSRLVPSLSDPRSLYVPGSYMVGDVMQAFGALGDPARRPSNPLEVLGRGIGIPVAKDPSWLDHLLGTQ